LQRDDGVGLKGGFDLLCDSASQLAAGVESHLELVAMKVRDVEDSNAVLSVGVHAVRHVPLRRVADIPDVAWATAQGVKVT